MSPEELRALDAYLAEHLLGWTHATIDQRGEYPADYVVGNDGNAWWLSTSYEGMAVCLTALKERGWSIAIEHTGFTGAPWSAALGKATPPIYRDADADTLPLAVALAARAAIEAEGVQS